MNNDSVCHTLTHLRIRNLRLSFKLCELFRNNQAFEYAFLIDCVY